MCPTPQVQGGIRYTVYSSVWQQDITEGYDVFWTCLCMEETKIQNSQGIPGVKM